MCSELRKMKYRHIFDTFLDFNKDGHIDKEDIDLVINKFCLKRQYNPGTPEHNYVTKLWYDILESLLSELDTNKDRSISKEEWEAVNDKFAANPTKAPKWQSLYEDWVFKYFNPEDGPGVTKEHFTEVMTFYGLPKESVIAAFDRMSKGKDFIPEAEYRRLWKEYFVSEDPNALGNHLGVFPAEILNKYLL